MASSPPLFWARLSPTAGALLSLHTPRYPDTEEKLCPAASHAHQKKTTLYQVSATREFTAWHEKLLPAKTQQCRAFRPCLLAAINSFKSSPDSCRAACQEGSANNRLAKLTGTACTNTHA